MHPSGIVACRAVLMHSQQSSCPVNATPFRVALAAAALLMAGFAALKQCSHVPEPQDICQAAEACDRMGLFWNTGAPGFPMPVQGYSALTISTEPVTTEEATSLFVGAPAERWRGKARAYTGLSVFTGVSDELRRVAWGNVTLIGDPALVDWILSR